MQAITIAIGKTGIHFFAEKYLSVRLSNLLNQLKPPDRTVPVPDFMYMGAGGTEQYSKISIVLRDGSLKNFQAAYQGVTQGVSEDANKEPIFILNMLSNKFSAFYNWVENYHFVVYQGDKAEGDSSNKYSVTFDFNPLETSFQVKFLFNGSKNEWEIVISETNANTTMVKGAAVPPNSILNNQVNDCIYTHVDSATKQAINAIDITASVKKLIAEILQTIPGSGDLGNGIVYDFSLSDPSQLIFPNNDGIQMGVKGGASYNNTPFSGDTPPNLPLPLPPSDSDAHHLNIYVSNYEVDALHWAYFSAGKLKTTVTPSDLPEDPQALKVSTYVDDDKALRPYHTFAMHADISPAVAPVTAFGAIWDFTDDVVKFLKAKLPSNLSDFLEGIRLNVFASKSQLEDYMKDADVNSEYFKTIEDAAQQMGMVVSSKLNFDLIIQGKEKPDIKFSLVRTDVLTNLRLGIGGNKAQTLKYVFLNATYDVEFTSSTVPGLSGANFGRDLWRRSGEPQYIAVLNHMGETGVPLPIMKDFQFDFAAAQLSIQEGYISILANVLYKNS
jgi:hypothetical protein